MNKVKFIANCPHCQTGLEPKLLACPCCDLELKGDFEANPLMQLSSNQMQFLQTFILCEGRIRDVERALNISYPTVKSRLKDLKQQFLITDAEPRLKQTSQAPAVTATDLAPEESGVAAILRLLEQGEVTYEDAIKRLKKR